MKIHIPNPARDALLCGNQSLAAQWTADDLCGQCLKRLAKIYEAYRALHPNESQEEPHATD